jgi:hypothetical protein
MNWIWTPRCGNITHFEIHTQPGNRVQNYRGKRWSKVVKHVSWIWSSGLFHGILTCPGCHLGHFLFLCPSICIELESLPSPPSHCLRIYHQKIWRWWIPGKLLPNRPHLHVLWIRCHQHDHVDFSSSHIRSRNMVQNFLRYWVEYLVGIICRWPACLQPNWRGNVGGGSSARRRDMRDYTEPTLISIFFVWQGLRKFHLRFTFTKSSIYSPLIFLAIKTEVQG